MKLQGLYCKDRWYKLMYKGSFIRPILTFYISINKFFKKLIFTLLHLIEVFTYGQLYISRVTNCINLWMIISDACWKGRIKNVVYSGVFGWENGKQHIDLNDIRGFDNVERGDELPM